MKATLLRSLLFCLCLTPTLRAADAKPAAAPATTPAPATPVATKPATEETLQLPTMQVTAQRIKKLDKEIKRLDKMISRESRNIKTTDLDKALNKESVAKAAAIFGGNSADHLAAVAASRVALLERERTILESMKRPLSLEDLKLLEIELEQTRENRRSLDDVVKQRY